MPLLVFKFYVSTGAVTVSFPIIPAYLPSCKPVYNFNLTLLTLNLNMYTTRKPTTYSGSPTSVLGGSTMALFGLNRRLHHSRLLFVFLIDYVNGGSCTAGYTQ